MSQGSQGGQEGDVRGQVAGIDGAMRGGVPALGSGEDWISQDCAVILCLGVGDSVASQHPDWDCWGCWVQELGW